MSRETTDADPIAPLRRRFVDACLRGDLDTLLSLFSDTAVMMAGNEPSHFGKQELEEWHQEYFQDFRVGLVKAIRR